SLFVLITPPPPPSTLFPYTTLFRSRRLHQTNKRDAGFGAVVICGCLPEESSEARILREDHLPRRSGLLQSGHGHLHGAGGDVRPDRKSTRLNSSHRTISYAVFCLKK